MLRKNLMSRRTILRSALGGLLLAPLLRERRLQAQNATPKRIITVFTPDSHPPEWWPTAGGGDYGFTLQEPLADFQGLESEMLFVQRIDHSWTYDNHHVAGIVQLFTGQKWIQQGQNEFADGPSIDQVLLQETDLRGSTPISSIQLGVDDGRTDARHVIAYSGSGQPLAGEVRPSRVYSNVFDGVTFGGSTSTPSEPAPAPAVNDGALADQRILQVNMDEVREIQRYLGQQEKTKLDAHLQSLSELEARIAASPGLGEPGSEGPVLVGGSCSDTETRDYSSGDLKRDGVISEWSKQQCDLIYNAFTCDRTRVANLNYSFSGGHHEGLLGFSASWHDEVAHISKTDDSLSVGGNDITSRAAFQIFDRFWASQIAYLVRRLAETAEGDGTMLDNTLVYWGVESGTNHNHSPRDMQYLLIGGRNIGFQVGQYLQLPNTESAHKLHTAVLNTFGMEASGFGVEPNSGALAGIGA